MWRLWCLALGDKAGRHDREADLVALVRTFIFATYLLTNITIVAGVVRHWDDVKLGAKVDCHCASD
ncbi:MAG: hypothetical protein EBS30_13660 [Planctomycetes bacterium]|nr:hypothetical protein [Planctomycetota bacterium]